MNSKTVKQSITGPAGAIECALDAPAGDPLGVAVICHPHPVHGGTMDNKVVITLVRVFLQIGWRTVRFNFRGAGASEGAWDEGRGEVDDTLAVIASQRRAGERFMLAGFSFGAYAAAEAASRLAADARPERMVLVGPSTQKQKMAEVPKNTVVVHGEADEVVPLAATFDWARPQALPVIVLPGVGHFFHGQLTLLKQVVVQQLLQPTA
jgi:uncharacterized protein